MDAQTLQQQTPIYHVCQHCGGEGCAACSDLLILDGDIQLDPEWSDDLPAMPPINGVIGTTPDYPFSTESRLANIHKLIARMPYRSIRSEDNRTYLEGCGL